MDAPIVLATFQIPIAFALSHEQKREALRLLNQHYLGEDECNKYDGGQIVPKYPDKETKDFADSHHACQAVHDAIISVSLLSNGHLSLP